MILKLFLLQITAHLVSDFLFQPQSWSEKKTHGYFTLHHFYHILIVGIFTYLFSLDPGFWFYALVLTILHLMTDILKSFLQMKFPDNKGRFFYMDQFIHLILIGIVVVAYDRLHGIHFIFDLNAKTIAIVAGIILCMKPANIMIKHLLSVFDIRISEETSPDSQHDSLPNAGKLIGITERLLALVLILNGQFEAVGLIIAAKSILRLNGTQKSEYVLTGTLLSFGIAVLTGILIGMV